MGGNHCLILEYEDSIDTVSEYELSPLLAQETVYNRPLMEPLVVKPIEFHLTSCYNGGKWLATI